MADHEQEVLDERVFSARWGESSTVLMAVDLGDNDYQR